MKDKILNFITAVKEIFSNRRKVIPKTPRAHQLASLAIEKEERNLESAYNTINLLDETNPNHFASSLFYHLMEEVVPVFTNWNARREKIKVAAATEIEGHIKVFTQYKEMKNQLRTLVLEVKSLNNQQLVELKTGKEIIKNYNRDSYLAEHPEIGKPENEPQAVKIKMGGI